MWKGDNAGYSSIHHWVRDRKGSAEMCENCGKTKWETRIEWSNIDHKYRRDVNDYQALCVKCHKEYDKNAGLKYCR